MKSDSDPSRATWYEATANRGLPRPGLSGTVEAEVCVIGGGLAGLTTALELARRGRAVALLESHRLAGAASGRNGGFVSNGFAEGMDKVAGRVGLDAAQALYRLSQFGTEFVRREIADSDPAIRMGDGWLGAIRYDNAAEKQAGIAAMARDYGQELQFLDVADVRRLLDTARYFQGSFDPSAFHMHPLRYALMIAAKSEAAGAVIFENTRAQSVEKASSGWTVSTPGGTLHCRDVVYCVSALDRAIHRPIGRAILPVATYVAVTEPLVQDAIRTRSAISDSRRAGNYYRLVDQGRLLWGGAITTRVSEPLRLASRMQRDMVSVYPQLGNPRIDFAWSGIMGYARHFMPLIGTDGDGQWWATAFGGHGMNTTALGGILISRAIAAKDDEYRRFLPFAPDWAGGPLGRVAVQLGYWQMQLRDRLDEARASRKAA